MLDIVVGGQYGSEGKGAVTAALCSRDYPAKVTVVRVGGPNAGHTAIDREGRAWALRQVPAGMVVDPGVRGVIAAGSEVDLEVLTDEITRLEAAGHSINDRLVVHESATLLEPHHREQEQASTLNARLGSTAKGIGVARMDRLNRTATLVGSMAKHLECEVGRTDWLNEAAADVNHRVVIEGTQGYGLGLHGPAYPYTTSGDCRAIDTLAQAGISPWVTNDLMVWLVVRPNPIRVAGNSGPLKGETTWEALGLGIERTTVTKKVRRVGAWDHELVEEAVAMNGRSHVRLALTMADHVVPEIAGLTTKPVSSDLADLVDLVEATGARVGYVGTGPATGIWL